MRRPASPRFAALPTTTCSRIPGPASNHLFVFPRTSTIIQHQGQRPIVTGPNLVMFYNQFDIYSRKKLSANGDSCDWFVVSNQLLEEVISKYDPAVVERPGRPFTFTFTFRRTFGISPSNYRKWKSALALAS